MVSFGHISFVAVGAWTAGVLSMPVEEKPAMMPNLFGVLGDHTVGNVPSLAIAAGVGAAYALVVGLPLMRLSGLAAGIATFGVLEITHNVLRYWEKIGPGLNTFSAVPETTGLLQAALGAVLAVVVAFAYSGAGSAGCSARRARIRRRRGPSGCRSIASGSSRSCSPARSPGSRAGSRPPAAAEHRERVPRPHVHHARDARDRRRDEPLGRGRRRARGQRRRLVPRRGGERHPLFGQSVDLPGGTRIVVVGALMALVLILRPAGLTGGREISFPRVPGARLLTKFAHDRSEARRTAAAACRGRDLTKAATLLFWDQRVMMPPGGAEARAEAIATVSRLAQERFVEDDSGACSKT